MCFVDKINEFGVDFVVFYYVVCGIGIYIDECSIWQGVMSVMFLGGCFVVVGIVYK